MNIRTYIRLQSLITHAMYFCGWCGVPFSNDAFRAAHENACSKNPMNGGK